MFRTQVVSPDLCRHHEPSIPRPFSHAEQILTITHLGPGIHTQHSLSALQGTDVVWAQALTLLRTWQRHRQFSEANLSQENLPIPLWDLGIIKPHVSSLYNLAPPLLLQIPTLHRYNISTNCRKWLQYGYKWICYFLGGWERKRLRLWLEAQSQQRVQHQLWLPSASSRPFSSSSQLPEVCPSPALLCSVNDWQAFVRQPSTASPVLCLQLWSVAHPFGKSNTDGQCLQLKNDEVGNYTSDRLKLSWSSLHVFEEGRRGSAEKAGHNGSVEYENWKGKVNQASSRKGLAAPFPLQHVRRINRAFT